jgi:Na+/H+ antiporter NhaD/arsenite permease-like protein
MDSHGAAAEVAHQVAHHAPEVAGSTTLLFALVLAGMIACLALEEKIHAKKSIIVGVFAVISLFLGGLFHLLPFGKVLVAGHEIAMPVYIPAVDWEVLAILVGASLFVDVSSESGLFSWIAIKLTKLSRGDPVRLLNYYAGLTVIFSAVLNNVTAMIIVGSLTAVSLAKLEKRDLLLGFLLVEGLLTNVGGLLTLISSVPNIIVGNVAGIPFMTFFFVAAPYVLLSTWVTVKMGRKLFGIEPLVEEEEIAQAQEMVSGFDENDQVRSVGFFRLSAVAMVLFIVCLAGSSVLPVIKDLGMGYVALSFAAGMLCLYRHEVGRFYSKLDWDLMAFFACLFAVIYTMEHAQVLVKMGEGIQVILGLGPELGAAGLLLASAAASAVTDNVPLAAVLAKILKGLGTASTSKLWWAVIFGANLGGNLTPIGSASTVVAVTVMTKHELKVSFLKFVKTAAPFAGVQLALAAVYVWLFL